MSGDARKHNLVRKKVISWYDQYGRRFPWRTTNDPYQILIAEMLLRRTTASAVSRVFNDFMSRFDSPKTLARAHESTIAQALNSLGLQSVRASQLKKTALVIVEEHDGEVPTSFETLQSLPGVGPYIASAVMNFAYGKSVSLVDGNVIHFISRVYGIRFPGPTDMKAWEFMFQVGGHQDARLYLGIIDLVAAICLKRNPRCDMCPLSELCDWFTKSDISIREA
jgi:A/G-specific adenine glycosylase